VRGFIACATHPWVVAVCEAVLGPDYQIVKTWGRSIVPSTQWDRPDSFEHGMFAPKSLYPRYEARAQQKMPQMGDISVRSALTIHRGTANRSDKSRPVLVLGVDAPGAGNAERHDLQVTRAFNEPLPTDLRQHMTYRVVDELEPIVQAYTIEGLVHGRGLGPTRIKPYQPCSRFRSL